VQDSLELTEEFAQLLLDSATYLWERGLLDTGEKLILLAEKICEIEAVDEALKSEVYAFCATFLAESGDLEGALGYFNKQAQNRRENVAKLRVRKCEPTIVDDIQLANAFNNLAGIYFALDDLEQAETYNELSLQIKDHWKDHADLDYILSLSYSNIGNVHARREHWEEAAIFYTRALEASSKSPDTLKRALTYHNFGCMRLTQGMLEAALELLTEAYRLRSEKLGGHFDTANTLHMLASCQFLLEDFQTSRYVFTI
jgi:tetratricopeptide (TPR) repeat protein